MNELDVWETSASDVQKHLATVYADDGGASGAAKLSQPSVPAAKIEHSQSSEVLTKVPPEEVMEPVVDRIGALAHPGGVGLGDVVPRNQVCI